MSAANAAARAVAAAALGVALGAAGGPARAAGPDAPAAIERWFGAPFGTPDTVGTALLDGDGTSLRFLATSSGCVRSLNFRWRFPEPSRRRAMYRDGDGGRYRVTIRADADGAPGPDALDATEFEPAVADAVGAPIGEGSADVPFGGDACLERGERYHVVFENLHPDPRSARVGLHGPAVDDAPRPAALALPCPGCADARLLRRDADGAWAAYRDPDLPTRFVLPHWCVGLDGGTSIGQPVQYGYASGSTRAAVYGGRRVRQRLEPVASERLPDGALELSFLVRKVVGDAPLEVRVDGRPTSAPVAGAAPSGERDAAPEAASEAMPVGGFAWYTVRAPADAFGGGAGATVEFATGPDTAYELVAGTQSARSCGVPVDGLAGGRAEVSDDGGESWSGFTVFGQADKPNVGLSLYATGAR